MTTQEISAFGYLVAFSNAGGSKLSDVENDAKFFIFFFVVMPTTSMKTPEHEYMAWHVALAANSVEG